MIIRLKLFPVFSVSISFFLSIGENVSRDDYFDNEFVLKKHLFWVALQTMLLFLAPITILVILLMRSRWKPKILIIGHARHGKDTAAEYIRDTYNIAFESTSMYMCRYFVYPYMTDQYNSYIECFNDRMNQRKYWFIILRDWTIGDPSKLVRYFLRGYDIYVGLRRQIVLDDCIKKDLFDVILWIDASGRLHLEPQFSIEFDSENMFWIDNNMSIPAFYSNIDAVISQSMRSHFIYSKWNIVVAIITFFTLYSSV